MRNAFPSYYRSSTDELKELWSDATFIFDANVLLDLHRYSKPTRDEFLSVLKKYLKEFGYHTKLDLNTKRIV
jgi:hypothetical protein